MIEDPFGLERITVELPAGASILVYPRLVDVDRLFSESGARTPEGRRLLLRGRPGSTSTASATTSRGSRFAASTGRRRPGGGQLMVKELEDSPRDETAVLLDADAAAASARRPTRASSSPSRRRARSSRTPPAGAGR